MFAFLLLLLCHASLRWDVEYSKSAIGRTSIAAPSASGPRQRTTIAIARCRPAGWGRQSSVPASLAHDDAVPLLRDPLRHCTVQYMHISHNRPSPVVPPVPTTTAPPSIRDPYIDPPDPHLHHLANSTQRTSLRTDRGAVSIISGSDVGTCNSLPRLCVAGYLPLWVPPLSFFC